MGLMRVRPIAVAIAVSGLAAADRLRGDRHRRRTRRARRRRVDRATGSVRLLAHDSFVLSESLLADFTEETGLTVEVVTGGDAGTMVAGAVLAAGSPTADVMYGVDSTLLSRAVDAGVFEPYPRRTSGSWLPSSSRAPQTGRSRPSTTATCASTSTTRRSPSWA